jgi:excisionase family DNA binding protein
MKYLSINEAAKELGKSRQWIWTLIKMNRIKAIRIGKQFAISEEEIENYRH